MNHAHRRRPFRPDAEVLADLAGFDLADLSVGNCSRIAAVLRRSALWGVLGRPVIPGEDPLGGVFRAERAAALRGLGFLDADNRRTRLGQRVILAD